MQIAFVLVEARAGLNVAQMLGLGRFST